MSGMKHIPSTRILDTEYSAHFAGLRQWYEGAVPQDGKAKRLRHNACARFFTLAKTSPACPRLPAFALACSLHCRLAGVASRWFPMPLSLPYTPPAPPSIFPP